MVGIVHCVEGCSLGFTYCTQGWLNHRTANEKAILLNLFDQIFDDLYTYVTQNLLAKMETLQCMQITQVG